MLLIVVLCSVHAVAERHGRGMNYLPLMQAMASLPDDSLRQSQQPDTLPRKREALEAPVTYEANDSILFTQAGWGHLYGQGKVNYQQIELTADVISMNMD